MPNQKVDDKTTLYDFSAKTITGETKNLSDYKGKVVIVVNTASLCGFTPQYAPLQALYVKYRDKGLEILGFPCNQFANQEPGTDEEILRFVRAEYSVEFQMFSKIEVNGENAHPLYKWLTTTARGYTAVKSIRWNFTKFLMDRNGKLIKRFPSRVDPMKMEDDIAEALWK